MIWVWQQGANPFWQSLWATFFGVLLAAVLAFGTQTFFHQIQRRRRDRERRQRQIGLIGGLLNELVEKTSWLKSAQKSAQETGYPPLFSPTSGVWIAVQGELVAGGLPGETIFRITKAQAALDWVMEGVIWLRRINDDPSWVWPAQQEAYYEAFGGKRATRMQMQLERIRLCLEDMEQAQASLVEYAAGLSTETGTKLPDVATERMQKKHKE